MSGVSSFNAIAISIVGSAAGAVPFGGLALKLLGLVAQVCAAASNVHAGSKGVEPLRARSVIVGQLAKAAEAAVANDAKCEEACRAPLAELQLTLEKALGFLRTQGAEAEQARAGGYLGGAREVAGAVFTELVNPGKAEAELDGFLKRIDRSVDDLSLAIGAANLAIGAANLSKLDELLRLMKASAPLPLAPAGEPLSKRLQAESDALHQQARALSAGLGDVKEALAASTSRLECAEADAKSHDEAAAAKLADADTILNEASAARDAADVSDEAAGNAFSAAEAKAESFKAEAAHELREAVRVRAGAAAEKVHKAVAEARLAHADGVVSRLEEDAEKRSSAAERERANETAEAARHDATAGNKEAEARDVRSNALKSFGGGTTDGELAAALAALARTRAALKAAASAAANKDAAVARKADARDKTSGAQIKLKDCLDVAKGFIDAGDVEKYEAEMAKEPALKSDWRTAAAKEKHLVVEEDAAAAERAAGVAANEVDEAAAAAGGCNNEAAIAAAEQRLSAARRDADALDGEARNLRARAEALRGKAAPESPKAGQGHSEPGGAGGGGVTADEVEQAQLLQSIEKVEAEMAENPGFAATMESGLKDLKDKLAVAAQRIKIAQLEKEAREDPNLAAAFAPTLEHAQMYLKEFLADKEESRHWLFVGNERDHVPELEEGVELRYGVEGSWAPNGCYEPGRWNHDTFQKQTILFPFAQSSHEISNSYPVNKGDPASGVRKVLQKRAKL
jgi:hypothetical protein